MSYLGAHQEPGKARAWSFLLGFVHLTVSPTVAPSGDVLAHIIRFYRPDPTLYPLGYRPPIRSATHAESHRFVCNNSFFEVRLAQKIPN